MNEGPSVVVHIFSLFLCNQRPRRKSAFGRSMFRASRLRTQADIGENAHTREKASGMNQSNTLTLVLLPGMDGTGELFRPFVLATGKAFDTLVVAYPPDQPLDYTALEVFVRNALPTDRPYLLLGESFSGPIAVALAASKPTQLKGLVLCSTFVRTPRPVFRKLRPLVNVLPFGRTPIRWISRLLLGRFSTAALREALNQAISRVTPDVMRARLHSVLAVDVSTALMQVDVPVLYLRALNDWVVPASASAWVLQLKPNVRIADVDAPHCLLQTMPEAAAQHIKMFAATLQDNPVADAKVQPPHDKER